MKKLILLLLFIPLVSFGQDYGNDSDALKLCTAIQTNSFISDSKADNALDKILSVIGASKRFVLQPCDNINNAVATSYKGIRYILYDRDFMDSLDSGDNWSNLFILAHEVGHHINGHSLDIILYANDIVDPKSLEEKRNQELEADEFAGFILGKLGATLEQTSSSIKLISSNKDDTYSTHPSKSKRLASIETGFNKATGNETVVYETPTNLQTAEDYFWSAYNKAKLKDYYGAIPDFTKAIEIEPNYAIAYYFKAHSKSLLGNDYGAIADYTKAIELDPNYADAYIRRGSSKSKLEDHYGAITDFTKTIEVEPNFSAAYVRRGMSKVDLKDYYGAIPDFTKAIEIEPNYAIAYLRRGAAKLFLKDYYGAIADFTKTIEVEPNTVNIIEELNENEILATAYAGRAYSKEFLRDYNGACQDGRKAQSLGFDVSQIIENACN